MPRVSVVIPTHNRADRVGAAIRSVVRQTFSDLDVVVVDDGSRESAEQAVRAAADPRVRFVRHETAKGDGAARNAGIRRSAGELVAFLDDDDEWLPDKLQLQVGEFDRDPSVGLVHTSVHLISDGTPTTPRLDPMSTNGKTQVRRGQITTSSVMVRRRCIEAVGLFDETIPYCSDADLWIRLARVYTVRYLEAPLIRYFASQSGLSGNLQKVIEGKHKVLAKHAAFFEEEPASYSDYLVALGFLCCYDGQPQRGRAAFGKAIRLRPAAWKAYVHYTLSLVGPKGFRMLETLPRRLGLPWGAAPLGRRV